MELNTGRFGLHVRKRYEILRDSTTLCWCPPLLQSADANHYPHETNGRNFDKRAGQNPRARAAGRNAREHGQLGTYRYRTYIYIYNVFREVSQTDRKKKKKKERLRTRKKIRFCGPVSRACTRPTGKGEH